MRVLRRQLDHPVKTAKEKTFVLERLHLLDQFVFFEISLRLWQTYFDFGCEEHIWPVSLKQLTVQ